MLPNRIKGRHDFINAIASNDTTQMMLGVWSCGCNFYGVYSVFGDYSRVTPLMVAIERGDFKTVERLLTHSRDPADPNMICEGSPLFTSGDFGDYLYISPLARCLQRHHLAEPAQKQAFTDIYNRLRDFDADLYATPPVNSDLSKTALQENWERDIDQQMAKVLTHLHEQLEGQYQIHKENQRVRALLENTVKQVDVPQASPKKQKI